MFSDLRLKKRRLDDETTRELLKNGEYGVFSTCGEDGYAYGVPVNYVLEGDSIYFHCAAQGKKLANIRFNDRVCFTVTARARILAEELTTSYESAVLFGRAELIDGEEKNRALRLIVEKYAPAFLVKGDACIEKSGAATGVVRIRIENLCGKKGH